MKHTHGSSLDDIITGLMMEEPYVTGNEITYSFDLPPDIARDGRNSKLNQVMIDRHLEVFDEVTRYTGVTFTEVDGSVEDSDFYFTFRERTETAYVYGYNDGVMHVHNPDRIAPVMGTYEDHLILHELGHGLGLKHGHDDHALPDAYQGHSWSLMSYRAHPDSWSLYFGAEHAPETFMIGDIAALQHRFGANFETEAGDTVYQVDFDTGELLIDGVSQGVPISEKMQRAIWDGGGVDTLDLSNGRAEMTITLQPGDFTSFGDRYLPDATGFDVHFAEGNIANPFLYQGNTASLLENAIGGKHDDLMIGNVLANVLTGGAGADVLYGMQGADTLNGGLGDDLIIDGLGDTVALGGRGDDVIVALSGASSLEGMAGDDILVGGIDGDYLSGGEGSDVIRGEGGRGLLFGDDTIDGGSGDDLLMGGRGVDHFAFRPDEGDNVIAGFTVGDFDSVVAPENADFTVGVDKIVLVNFRGVDARNVMDHITDEPDGAIYFNQGTRITFYDVSAGQLTADDFIF